MSLALFLGSLQGIIPGKDSVKVPLEFKFTHSGAVDVKLPFVVSGSLHPPVDLRYTNVFTNVCTYVQTWTVQYILVVVQTTMTIYVCICLIHVQYILYICTYTYEITTTYVFQQLLLYF